MAESTSAHTVIRSEDILGDGGIVKDVYAEGSGDEVPQRGQEVKGAACATRLAVCSMMNSCSPLHGNAA